MPFNKSLLPAQTVGMEVLAFDNYFSGVITDVITVPKYTFGSPKFSGGGGFVTVPLGNKTTVPVSALPGGAVDSPSQTGLLMLYYDGAEKESEEVLIK